ncbi:hypothetical protein C495_12375 [Natronorubrum sulfidifaciens JCM 14089]|uniref:Uncharacterized protein n=1 Tax=Natronorubrum sulfidifaciens JCM 14089 TaxID=1230460 RepID=L9W696_9EURY|nr:hypothetical protein C495_12375 [Natronorubrum sulfidifaciens JCM 14089]
MTASPTVDLDSEASLRIDCYVRSTVPPTVTGTINDVVDRLQRLAEAGRIDSYRTTHWPPACHTVEPTPTADARPETRADLVGEFERWAARHGHSLEPAFRRREIQQTPFGLGCDEPREQLRVPFVSLAIYETDDETADETLRGVLPYTEQPQTGDERTYTVDDWLSTVEPTATRRLSAEQPTRLESHQ